MLHCFQDLGSFTNILPTVLDHFSVSIESLLYEGVFSDIIYYAIIGIQMIKHNLQSFEQ